MIRQNFPCFPFFPHKKLGFFGPPGPPTDEGSVFYYTRFLTLFYSIKLGELINYALPDIDVVTRYSNTHTSSIWHFQKKMGEFFIPTAE